MTEKPPEVRVDELRRKAENVKDELDMLIDAADDLDLDEEQRAKLREAREEYEKRYETTLEGLEEMAEAIEMLPNPMRRYATIIMNKLGFEAAERDVDELRELVREAQVALSGK